MNGRKGFTLVELLAVIVILAIILAIAIPGISGIIRSATKGAFESDAKMLLTAINYQKIQNDAFAETSINKDTVVSILKLSNDNYESVTTTLVGNKVRIVVVGKNKWAGLTAYGTMWGMNVVNSADFDETPPIITMLGSSPVEIEQGDTYIDVGATATDNKDGTITGSIAATNAVNTSVVGTYTVTYNVTDNGGNVATPVVRTVTVLSPYVASEGVNRPKLATGMIPVKWSTDHWVTTTKADADWYQYGTTAGTRNWANVIQVTNPGSYSSAGTTVDVVNDVIAFWVWIPRYVYNISAGWHEQMTTTTGGTILVQFSQGTNDNWNSAVIGDINVDTSASASSGQWTDHPAFKFGDDQLTGIWVAKFEASGATDALNFKPNAEVLLYLTASDMFSATRNMETNTRYGWGATGTNIDTHMMKNVEWGAVAYLSKSIYGKEADEIWVNPANNYTTGCAGSGVSSSATSGCINPYSTTDGVKASTTGNIYGIYDISGGAYEYTLAYVNNGHDNLSTYGESIISADDKYKDIYTVTSDSNVNNYNNAADKKGDAVFETSSSYTGSTSWFGDYSNMPTDSNLWFVRGASYNGAVSAGAFHFSLGNGAGGNYISFRSVVSVGTGL